MVAEEEMTRVATGRVVAVVEHVHPLGDLPDVQRPRHPMSLENKMPGATIEDSVAMLVPCCPPRPALVLASALDLLRESLS